MALKIVHEMAGKNRKQVETTNARKNTLDVSKWNDEGMRD